MQQLDNFNPLNESYSIPEFNKLVNGDAASKKFVQNYIDKGVAVGSLKSGEYMKLSKEDTRSEDFATKILPLNILNRGVDVVFMKGNNLLAKIRCILNIREKKILKKTIYENPQNLKGSEIYDQATTVFALSVELTKREIIKKHKETKRNLPDQEVKRKAAEAEQEEFNKKQAEGEAQKKLRTERREKFGKLWFKANKEQREQWLKTAGYDADRIPVMMKRTDIAYLQMNANGPFEKLISVVTGD